MSLRLKLMAAGATACVALGIGGAAIANAATSQTTTAPSTQAAASTQATPSTQATMPAHGTATHEDAEQAVTGTAATKAQAAAVKAVGGGTAGAVTTDITGSGYEVTVTKSDGSTVEVHLDSSFSVTQGPGGSSN